MNSLLKFSLRLGDNALILGQRMSEWCGHGPFLEEDIAMANTALDYIGRARTLYSYAASIDRVRNRTEDYYAYYRDEGEFENLQICELPIGDYAFTMARQFLFDSYCRLIFGFLSGSDDKNRALSGIASKVVKESAFHLTRSSRWMSRLGKGTEESRERIDKALVDLWGYTDEFFDYDEVDREMVALGFCMEKDTLKDAWLNLVRKGLLEAELEIPESHWAAGGGRCGVHTEHMGRLLAEMQVIQRRYPDLSW